MSAEVVLIPAGWGLVVFAFLFPPVACAAAYGCYLLIDWFEAKDPGGKKRGEQ